MKPPRLVAVLPIMLTLGNAACGFGAITFAAKLGPTDLSGKASLIAAALIFLAMVFDMLDGSVARLMKQTSDIGAQLDSLCDAISFGVAPAFLMLQFVLLEQWPQDSVMIGLAAHKRLLWTIAVVYTCCALLRLARFNVETEEDDSHEEFSGLPSPAAAGTVAAFPIALPGLLQMAEPGTPGEGAARWLIPAVRLTLPVITLMVAGLMVSRIRYPHFFSQLFRGQRTRRHVLQLVFTLAVIFWVHELAVPVIFCVFAFGAPLRWLWSDMIRGRLYKSPRI